MAKQSKRTDSGDFAVGYGKPPKASEFRKGQSGNPKGRPKGSKNAARLLQDVMNQKVAIQENGHRRLVAKSEAALMQIMNSAAAGDKASQRLMIQLLPYLNAQAGDDAPQPLTTEADMKVMNGFADRFAILPRIDNIEEQSK